LFVCEEDIVTMNEEEEVEKLREEIQRLGKV
jgi:hypothetical protein